MKKNKILIVGNWAWDIYEKALSRGFESEGWDVVRFKTVEFLSSDKCSLQLRRFRTKWTSRLLNEKLLECIEKVQPDIVLLVRCDEILCETLKTAKQISPKSFFIAYHNDNPFHGFIRRFTMRHFLKSLSIVDLTIVYRPSNIVDALNWGSKNVKVLPPSILRDFHVPTYCKEKNDIIFIGHYEDDGRDKLLQMLYESDIVPRIYGSRWGKVQRKIPWLKEQEIFPVWGSDYPALLSSAKIGLVFLSGKNKDVYTRRCFEIPACGTLMMAPRTSELEKFFKDKIEAVFWDSPEDLISKIHYYLENEDERIDIASSGRKRVLLDGHDEYGRAKLILGWYKEVLCQTNIGN